MFLAFERMVKNCPGTVPATPKNNRNTLSNNALR